jgi:predicted nuclease of predicted toxin-antitoxin system
MEFLIDANLPHSSKILLEELGYKARHVADVGLGASSDDEIFRYAQKHKCIIITRDLDFANAVRFKPGKHFGVIVMRISYLMTAKQINRILREFIKKVSISEIENGLVIVEIGRYRLRKN